MEGSLQRTLGANLRSYRTGRHLSQEQLALELGVHRTYLASVERGERNLSLKSVERLAESLNLDPIGLLTAQPS